MSVEGSERPARKKWMFFCILVVAGISCAGWLRLRVDSSLEPMLPENSQARQTILFFRDSSFGDKALLWFRLTGSGSLSDLVAAADATEKRLDPHLIVRVIRPPNESSAVDEAVGMLDRAGELLGQSDLADVEKAASPGALGKRMRECYLQLIKPEGSFFLDIMRRDPLGVSSRILGRLYALSKGLGYRMEIKDGHFVHSDGRQLLLILETSTTATSTSSSAALVAHLRELCNAAPLGVEIIPICGQIHTEQNDQFIKRDVHLAGTINAVAFLLLFLFVSRDWRVASVFLLPVVTTGLALGMCAAVYPHLSAMMIGLTIAMAGSAVDYGIFVYTAVRMGNDLDANIRRIRRPLLISHLTTLGVFVAFTFSSIPGYRQLGVLTSMSLIGSLLAALFVLPKLLKPGGRIVALGSGMALQRWGGKMVPVTIVAGIVLVVGVFIAGRIKFDSDISRLDGVSATVKQNEKDFQKTWGRSETELALLVVTGKTCEEAERANDEIYKIVSPHFGEGEFVSLSSFWPSAATRAANLARWRQFWSPERIAKLRSDLAAAGERYGFSAGAFDPFFQSLSASPAEDRTPQILAGIEEQFVARANGQWQMLNYFEDTGANTSSVLALIRDRPDAEVVSRGVMSEAFKESAVSETHLLVPISVAFIAASLLLLTKSVVKSLIIMLPVLSGLVAMLAVLEMMSISISVVTVVSTIIVLALTSDYGVFAVYAWEGRETLLGQGMASVHLSFYATMAGISAMIFARHPALFQVGVSLTAGLTAGYLTAFLVIPGICFVWDRWKRGAGA